MEEPPSTPPRSGFFEAIGDALALTAAWLIWGAVLAVVAWLIVTGLFTVLWATLF